MQTERGPTTGERELSATGTDQARGSEVQKEKERALLWPGRRKDEVPRCRRGEVQSLLPATKPNSNSKAPGKNVSSALIHKAFSLLVSFPLLRERNPSAQLLETHKIFKTEAISSLTNRPPERTGYERSYT